MKKSEINRSVWSYSNLVVWELLYTMDQKHLVVLYALDDDNISIMINNQKGFDQDDSFFSTYMVEYMYSLYDGSQQTGT
jgi:hypothetical protein